MHSWTLPTQGVHVTCALWQEMPVEGSADCNENMLGSTQFFQSFKMISLNLLLIQTAEKYSRIVGFEKSCMRALHNVNDLGGTCHEVDDTAFKHVLD